MNICIYGASSATLEPVYYAEAEKLGELLASAGHALVFGGGREGLMGAAARGVHKMGGGIIGIAPRFFDEPGILYEHCTEMLYTDTMRERKQLMEERSQATVVLPGGIGTYEEFFEMLTLKQLGRTDRAIVIVTHNMQQAARISDNTAFFLLGELVEFGKTEQVFSTPADKRTEDYITGRFG